MYVYSDSESKGCVFNLMEDVLLGEAGAQDEEDIGNYLLFYHGKKAIHHLFQVAAGLDSMVIGEDQILGQVKTAHKQAREAGTTGVYLNTFFRMAVTGAKKVKTETELSKTSVSTATLALKVAEEEYTYISVRLQVDNTIHSETSKCFVISCIICFCCSSVNANISLT